jgi:nitrate reductase delta subunit
MRILKVIALLLNYPNAEVQQHCGDLAMAISEAKEVPPEIRTKLLATVNTIYKDNLMDAQENYGLLFDQGRSMSLHLFEHVHGESRDRGQAMVDLMNVYQSNGFELDALELPDFLPLFLEYLATRPDLEAREHLADVAHIIARVCARLYERKDSESETAQHYAVLLEALLIIAGANEQLASVRQEVTSETPDNTPEAIDQEWEETAVTFGAPDQACGLDKKPSTNDTQPIHWVDPVSDPKTTNAHAKGYAS